MTEEVSSKLAEVGQLKGEIADKLFEEGQNLCCPLFPGITYEEAID